MKGKLEVITKLLEFISNAIDFNGSKLYIPNYFFNKLKVLSNRPIAVYSPILLDILACFTNLLSFL